MTEIETPLTEPEAPEATPRPKTLTTIAILLAALALLSAIGFALTFAPIALLGGGPGRFSTSVSAGQGGPSLEGTAGPIRRGSGPVFSYGPGGSGGPQGGFQSAGPGGAVRPLGMMGPAFFIVRNVLAVLGIVLAGVAAWFVWRQKRWALNLGMVLAVLLLLGALPGLLFGGGPRFVVADFMGWMGYAQTGLTILKPLLALPVIVLSMLPSVRDFTS
jgi:hypothetical protein